MSGNEYGMKTSRFLHVPISNEKWINKKITILNDVINSKSDKYDFGIAFENSETVNF